MDYFEINPKYIESCTVSYRRVNRSGGCVYGTVGSCDHPSFAALRDHLEAKGYIKTWRGGWNGDTVLTKFVLNGKLFEEGDRFPSAGAMSVSMRCKNKRNHGEC